MHRLGAQTSWPAVRFGSWRLWDAGVAWPSLEPRRGEWQFERLDGYVDLAERHHVDLLLPLALTPAWASSDTQQVSSSASTSMPKPPDLGLWRQYVYAVASRYRGRIHAYEIWNEPNMDQFYSGSVRQMVGIVREARGALKQVDSTILVVSPAPVGEGGLRWLQEFFAIGGGSYVDIIGYHFYVINEPPEALRERIARVRGIMAAYGLENRPLWNTETGWIITESDRSVDPRSAGFAVNTKVLSQTEAADYVARALIVGWTAGLRRFYWYAWDNYAMGLVEQDGRTLKPAADAFGQVETWLVGAQLTCDQPNNNGTWVCPVTRPQAGPRLVIWNPVRTAPFEPPAAWSTVSVRQLSGSLSRLKRAEIVADASPRLIEPTGLP